MKYAIYGINRVAKDFLYIFNNLDISYFIEDTDDIFFEGYRVLSVQFAIQERNFEQIIICDFEMQKREEKLRAFGLKYGIDYLFVEDFFLCLDDFCIPSNRKLAVWGTGNMAEYLLQQNLPYHFSTFIDSNKGGNCFHKYHVQSPKDIVDWKQYFVIIAVVKDAEIIEWLNSTGLTEIEDYVSYQKIIGLPSNMLRKTIFDQAYYDLECNTMENHLEILSRGNTRCCCTTFVQQNLDNIFHKNISELWHSKIHRIMCLSTENRTYSFCDKTMCPLFVAKPKQDQQIRKEKYKTETEFPSVISLGYDSSCNLSCITCRANLYYASDYELEEMNKITDIIVKNYLPNCIFLILAGDGEVFASKVYGDIYRSKACNPDYIRILSNGILFTPEKWNEFINKKSGKIMMTISIDAASRQTYEKIRRNGNFERLKQNMEYAAELRKRGELSYLRFNFVVQKENYQEMIAFVQWGERLGVDEVFFTKILNWGTYSKEEFRDISMMEEDGHTPKEELQQILNHPVMKSSIVDLGTIQYSHKVDMIDVVENYYMWELEKRGGNLFR